MKLKKFIQNTATASGGVLFLIGTEVVVLFVLLAALVYSASSGRCFPGFFGTGAPAQTAASSSNAKSFIKWVDFDVTNEALRQALRYDVDSYGKEPHYNWVELLAYLGARYGGDFSKFREKDMDGLAAKLSEGATMEELTADMKYYP